MRVHKLFRICLPKHRVQDFYHLILALYAACCFHHVSILEIHREWQSHEICTFRQISYETCRRDVKILVIECDMRIHLLQFFHNSINRDAHRSHSPTADHKVFIVFYGFLNLLFRFQMFNIRFQLTPDLINGENAWVNINNITLNEGIPLPLTVNGSITGTDGVIVSLNAFLEGPFDVTNMSTDLNPSVIPNNQPYNTPPWSYSGTESVGAIPSGSISDWILVELRDTPGSAATATPGTRIARQAGFILNDGSIVSTDGISNMIFGVAVSNNLYVIVWHRNHLGIMSAVPLTFGGGLYSYDFTTAANHFSRRS